MEGEADIERETQNLRVVVVPEINAGTASLAYAFINPAIGLGTFLAQYALRKPIADGEHARIPRHRPLGRSEGRAGRAQRVRRLAGGRGAGCGGRSRAAEPDHTLGRGAG